MQKPAQLKANTTAGVIFLTTNRLTAFDSAFESRIQLKLFYNALTIKQRESIWKSLVPKSSMATADDQVYNRLARKHDINGREIKNMIKEGDDPDK
jgi:SpoVK/Ycf46/Vps4 family AAA+-type ATPase